VDGLAVAHEKCVQWLACGRLYAAVRSRPRTHAAAAPDACTPRFEHVVAWNFMVRLAGQTEFHFGIFVLLAFLL
jgi:hypothetical protein